jgi:superfamily II helicase
MTKIKNKTVTCGICNKDKPFSEIVKRHIIKGEKVYICKDCYEEIREIPDDYDFHHQF